MINTETTKAEPISKGERIRELDIVRGFALLGVLLVNLAAFNSTLFSELASIGPLSNPLNLELLSDRLATLFIQILGEGKFYTIFSFLFGLGFYIFMERAEAKGVSPNKLFVKRSFFLLLFGIIHFSLVWYGDILHVYGVVGFLLLPFKNCSYKTIRNWLIALLIISTLFMVLSSVSNALLENLSSDLYDAQMASYRHMADKSIDVYQNGSFLEIIRYRLGEEAFYIVFYLIFMIPKILGMFLIGLYVGKRKIFKDIEGNQIFIKKVWRVGGLIGILSTIVYVLIEFSVISLNPILSAGAFHFFKEIATIFLSMFYVTSLMLLYRKASFKKLLSPLGYIGQMALTNYLVQCTIASLIYYGHGLGLVNKVGLATGILFTLVIYSVQIVTSKLWLNRFKYGPFEWIWRQLTYGGLSK
ncbi:DUF418 domain-containing protein [Alkaliphilus serpentinus]|uniref:DUF418 domain-containing protein n=1 Tax=Alkaliphilus serpentinus TaxID=1482731 RepID=A0A833HR92_9FIRM|nr:DUF418 domain-containing protein [Alkaliphilus serpentinus]KAB3532823.1 DUF418 domain-containing protein [Alkaliphilus serpentinus]